CNNLYKKWVAFYSKEPPRRNLVIKPLGPVKTRRIQIKNNFHVASMMNLMLVGDPALIAFAYNTGLGQKNSMGFGMISVVS
ncbi:MAG: CRISPR-associated endoribonuclease Cas6, partial [Candidatus Anstonellales archaeon]